MNVIRMDSSILYVDLLRQASYKNVILLSLSHKQKTYFSKKYSKMNRIVLKHNKVNNLTNIWYLTRHQICVKQQNGWHYD